MTTCLPEIATRLAQNPRAAELPAGCPVADFDARCIEVDAASVPELQTAGITVTGEFGRGNLIFLPKSGVETRIKLSFSRNASGNTICVPTTDKMKIEVKIGGSQNMCLFGGGNPIAGVVNFKTDHSVVLIGPNTTANYLDILVAGQNRIVSIGEDCMFAVGIVVRTSDSHSVIDLRQDRVVNTAGDVHIGDHVWIGARATVMKGVRIGKGSIIGGGAIVTRDVPDFCLAAGVPARIVKRDVSWSRAVITDQEKAATFSQALKTRLGYLGGDPAA